MKFKKPISGGILIAGSLFWDEHPTRKALRKSYLAMQYAVDVPAPIRYGRLSEKRNTVTMVFSKSCTTPDTIGQGKLVPFNAPIKNNKEFDAVTKAIIKAEHKKEPGFSRFNWGWGCLAVLINPNASSQTKKLIKKYWSSRFGSGFNPNDYRVGKEKSVVSASGILNMEWQGRYGDLDFIIVTATKPNLNPIPSEDELSKLFSLDDEYFQANYRVGILTYQDNKVLNWMDKRNKSRSTNAEERNGFFSFPQDWKLKKLGELFEFKNGINAGKESYGRGTKFINVMEVINNDSLTAELLPGSVHISKEQRNLYLVSKGDVLFNRTSETSEEIGLSSVYIDKEPVVFGGFVIRGRPRDVSIHTDFKRYCFRSKFVRDQIVRGGQGAIRTNIGQGDLEKVLVAFPSINEQKYIASVLLQWDYSISILSKLLLKKTLRKRWLMQQLLTGKIRLAKSGHAWKHVRFKEIYSQITRKAGNEKHIVLSVTKEGIISQAEYFKKEIASEDTSPYLVVEKGDMVMSGLNFWMGSIDVLSTYEKGMVSPAYKVFTISNKNISPEFMKHFVRSQEMLRALIGSSVTGASIVRRNMDRETLDEWSFHLPDYGEQVAIAQLLNTAVKELDLLKAKVKKLQEQKRGLMQQLLTGKKRFKL